MSATWLITDGFAGAPNGVSKVPTMGLYSGSAPPAPTVTYTPNWLSPSMRMSLIAFAVWLGFHGSR